MDTYIYICIQGLPTCLRRALVSSPLRSLLYFLLHGIRDGNLFFLNCTARLHLFDILYAIELGSNNDERESSLLLSFLSTTQERVEGNFSTIERTKLFVKNETKIKLLKRAYPFQLFSGSRTPLKSSLPSLPLSPGRFPSKRHPR